MHAKPTAHVSLNGASFPIAPGLADHLGSRGHTALSVGIRVELDADDVAAALLTYLEDCGGDIDDLTSSDEYAWETIAEVLVNHGLGSAFTSARESIALPSRCGNPALAVFCKERTVRLLADQKRGPFDARTGPQRTTEDHHVLAVAR